MIIHVSYRFIQCHSDQWPITCFVGGAWMWSAHSPHSEEIFQPPRACLPHKRQNQWLEKQNAKSKQNGWNCLETSGNLESEVRPLGSPHIFAWTPCSPLSSVIKSSWPNRHNISQTSEAQWFNGSCKVRSTDPGILPEARSHAYTPSLPSWAKLKTTLVKKHTHTQILAPHASSRCRHHT